jgi:hypothetical protein
MSDAIVANESAAPSGRFRLHRTPHLGTSGLSLTDLIVIIGGILLLIGGWGLQRMHDTRLATVAIDGVQVAYPERWLPLPALEPALAQWTDSQGTGATLTLYATDAPAPLAGYWLASPNPATGQPAYTPLESNLVTVNGADAMRTDYAYARQQIAQSSPPEIIRGREIAWLVEGRQHLLALEAPDQHWDRVAPLFDSLAGAMVGAKGGA